MLGTTHFSPAIIPPEALLPESPRKEDPSLWLSKLQAEALDALGVPHPPLIIPKTEVGGVHSFEE